MSGEHDYPPARPEETERERAVASRPDGCIPRGSFGEWGPTFEPIAPTTMRSLERAGLAEMIYVGGGSVPNDRGILVHTAASLAGAKLTESGRAAEIGARS